MKKNDSRPNHVNSKNFSNEKEKEIKRSDSTMSDDASESEGREKGNSECWIPEGKRRMQESPPDINDDLFEDYDEHEVL